MCPNESFTRPRRQGGRIGVFATLAALAAMLVLGAAPAQAQNGVGFAAVRGTGLAIPSTQPNSLAQFSAITNCDATQSTRPFYVRWTVDSTTYTFRKTSTDTSTCRSSPGDINENDGSGAGLVNGIPGAFVQWNFIDGFAGPEDSVRMLILTHDTASGEIVDIQGSALAGGIDPLNGTPGGVWVFGDLPWPAGG